MMMHCPDPLAPDDEELLRYIFGEGTLGENRKRHLEQCSTCQQRLSDYKQINNMLLPKLYRIQCPNATQLTLYCADMLSTDEVFAIDEHLRECPLCMDEVSMFGQEIAHFTPFPEPENRVFQETALRVLKRLVAQPIIQKSEMILRQDPSATAWSRQYQAEDFNLLFQLSRTDNNKMKLIGFFESFSSIEQFKALEGVVADLYHTSALPLNERGQFDKSTEEPVMSTTVDELGNFAFSPILPGNYIAIIHLPDIELVVEGLYIE
jgi:hypothetical protein